ncbi:hypothetical protein [Streptomyces ortus]|uniref:Integral membrane protein n=1 Tax=Streptomyces ortus TaxID=2867268 RepID=A0ABT3V698_9ACTN|nr:hypothetical protein [Streptomyces ortus]MCX4235226.1 hypothetical protein [Streptomyces ortus]
MSDQPYEGPYEGPYQGQGQNQGQVPYEGYDPYQQQVPQAQQGQQAPQAGWPGQQQYDEAAAQQQYTQQWEGQTWETQVQPPLRSAAPAAPAADTAYLPQQGPAEAAYGTYGAQQQPYGAQYGVVGQPMPGQQAPVGANPAPGAALAPASAPAPAPGGADGYGPATVTGNTRVTDAQRARAEGRSPIIEPGAQPAVLTGVLGLLLAGAAAVGQYALVVPLVILQAVTAAGWFRLNGMWPARQGIALAFAGALTADVALLVAGRENAPAAILGTLGVWVLLTLVLQLRSRAGADERMLGLMATVVSAALAIIATGYLAAEPDAVVVGGVAVAVAVLARALPLPTAASVVVAVLAAAGAGVAMGGVTDLGAGGAVLGAGAGVCALVGHRVASYDYPSRFVHFTAGVALPLAAAAPAVYLLGRALI